MIFLLGGWLRFALVGLLALLTMGCTSTSRAPEGRTAVPLAQIDGRLVVLSPTEIARLRPELAPVLEQRGYELVTDMAAADFLVLIRYSPTATDPNAQSIQVVSVSENRMRTRPSLSRPDMDDAVDASRSASAGFPTDIGTAEPSSRSR